MQRWRMPFPLPHAVEDVNLGLQLLGTQPTPEGARRDPWAVSNHRWPLFSSFAVRVRVADPLGWFWQYIVIGRNAPAKLSSGVMWSEQM